MSTLAHTLSAPAMATGFSHLPPTCVSAPNFLQPSLIPNMGQPLPIPSPPTRDQWKPPSSMSPATFRVPQRRPFLLW